VGWWLLVQTNVRQVSTLKSEHCLLCLVRTDLVLIFWNWKRNQNLNLLAKDIVFRFIIEYSSLMDFGT